jgi:ATP/maltotriose-dependent transcriptional regulator MalT
MQREERTPSRDPVAAPSHIIERPRLIKLMEESGARVIVLHAPAGYGKTTLAKQWLSRKGQRTAWYRCTASSTDVAALARSMAGAFDGPRRVLTQRVAQRITTSANPEADAAKLGSMVAERSVDRDPVSLLVIDDYQIVHGAPGAETFVEHLVSGINARVLVTSRLRPSWVAPRDIVYGDVVEIDRTLLAMTEAEAREALGIGSDQGNSLIAQSRGWPAVIGLAAALPSIRDQNDVPTALLEFLASEVFDNLEDAVKEALLCLSLSPSGSQSDVVALVGADGEEAVAPAVVAGFFAPATPDTTELHPLLRTFLRNRLSQTPRTLQLAASKLVGLYLQQGRWDDAFQVAAEAGSKDLALKILDGAFDELLTEHRISTLARWLHVVDDHEPARPLLDLGAAELAFREGLHDKAHRLAVESSRGFDEAEPRRAQALIRAGQAASQADKVQEARTLFLQAGAIARSAPQEREALLGELFAALELESEDLEELVDRVRDMPSDDLATDMRRESALLVVALRTGGLFTAVERAEPYRELIDRVQDPFARAAFTNALAHATNTTARYRTALGLTRIQKAFARQSGFNFAVPHTLHAEAMALMGLGQSQRAARTISVLSERATATQDVHFGLNAAVLRARHLLITDRAQAAADALAAPADERASAGLRAEYLATRALAFLTTGKANEALRAAEEASSATRWLAESAVLVSFVKSAARLRAGENATEASRDVLRTVSATGQVDAFVIAFRALPDAGAEIVSASSTSSRERAFSRVEVPPDLDFGIPRVWSVTAMPLSTRELEVYELLCRGMTNREIAEQLFLSEKTVKVHLRHIYEKLGVKTRTQAALLSPNVLGAREAS